MSLGGRAECLGRLGRVPKAPEGHFASSEPRRQPPQAGLPPCEAVRRPRTHGEGCGILKCMKTDAVCVCYLTMDKMKLSLSSEDKKTG